MSKERTNAGAARAEARADHDDRITEQTLLLFNALDTDADGHVSSGTLLGTLDRVGIRRDDPRLSSLLEELKRHPDEEMDLEAFRRAIRTCVRIVTRATRGQMVIPDFEAFSSTITAIYRATESNTDGDVADYIPQLGRVNPAYWAVGVCTIDGQRISLGDHEVDFCVQSCCKPINYCLVLEEHGRDEVHKYIGREPSGRGFNELTLDHDGRPHNPMINAGAIMGCALIRQGHDAADRFDYVVDAWRRLCGGPRPGFNNAVYLSERQTADRNFALGYFMREHGSFPEGSELLDTLE
ncbi:MAG: glutaminase, partial [Myxococcota bacterium]